MFTGIVGVCATCGWGHEPDQFADLGFESKEQYEKSGFANRIVIDDKKYCPDCAQFAKIEKCQYRRNDMCFRHVECGRNPCANSGVTL